MNSFEISLQADEWLDITSKEETLQNQLNHANEFAERRSKELEESTLQIDLLKGHKTLLETERTNLKADLKHSKDAFSRVSKDLEDTIERKEFLKNEFVTMKSTSDQHSNKLEHSLNSRKEELETAHAKFGSLNSQVSDLKNEHQKERKEASDTIESLTKIVEQLTNNLMSQENTSKIQHNALAQSERELRKSRAREEILQQELAQKKSESDNRSKELRNSQASIGIVSVLAEELKAKKVSLERSLAQREQTLTLTKKDLEQSNARETSLRTELSKVKTASEQRQKQLEESWEERTKDFHDSRDRIMTLEAAVDELKLQTANLVEERHGLEQDLAQEEALCQELSQQKKALEEDIKSQAESTKDDLQKAKDSVAHEQAMQEELTKQKAAFEARLGQIREILGVTALTEIKAVTTSPASCPSVKSPSLIVPLLHHVKFI